MRLPLYVLTILTSAFLLFSVQPLVGKALLPLVGGVPAGWTACLLFFQAALLAGYGYVWAGQRLSPRLRAALHLALVVLPPVAVAPFGRLAGGLGVSPVEHPVAFSLAFLALNVGLPFTALAATMPLASQWFSQVDGRRPYFLYAASNVGSLAALLAYPLAIEPWLDLPTQAELFKVGYGVVSVGLVAIAATVFRGGLGASAAPAAAADLKTDRGAARGAAPSGEAAADDADTAVEPAAVQPEAATPESAPPETRPLTALRRARWVGLSALPTALLAGATAHISQDLAPVPLLWVVPLALYLASFIVAFSPRIGPPPVLVERGAALLSVVLVFVTLTHGNEPVWLLVGIHLAFLFAASWIAHRRLADDAPDPRHLPEFYVLSALGGVLGTLSAAVLAPALLNDMWEYPAAIALVTMARSARGVVVADRPWRSDAPHVLGVVAASVVLGLLVPRVGLPRECAVTASVALPAVYAYRWMPLRRRYAACLAALVVGVALLPTAEGVRLSSRSFFGVVRVIDQGPVRALLHGTTMHGSQRLDERDQCRQRNYYAPDGTLGQVFQAHHARGEGGRTLVVGLGTGATSCWARPSEAWEFVEIDPDVVRIATDPAWFTYLRNSPSDDVSVVLGDGRARLEEVPDGSLALIFVDAFNSDAVPSHLIGVEAARLYLRKLRPGGWAVLHLSNRVLNLAPIVADVAAAAGAAARFGRDDVAEAAVLARRPEDLSALPSDRFRPLRGVASRAWTDERSSLVRALWNGAAR